MWFVKSILNCFQWNYAQPNERTQNDAIEIWFKIWFATHFIHILFVCPLNPLLVCLLLKQNACALLLPFVISFPPIDNLIFATSSTWWRLSCAVSLFSVRYPKNIRDYFLFAFWMHFFLYNFCYDSVENYVVAFLSRIKVQWKI